MDEGGPPGQPAKAVLASGGAWLENAAGVCRIENAQRRRAAGFVCGGGLYGAGQKCKQDTKQDAAGKPGKTSGQPTGQDKAKHPLFHEHPCLLQVLKRGALSSPGTVVSKTGPVPPCCGITSRKVMALRYGNIGYV